MDSGANSLKLVEVNVSLWQADGPHPQLPERCLGLHTPVLAGVDVLG